MPSAGHQRFTLKLVQKCRVKHQRLHFNVGMEWRSGWKMPSVGQERYTLSLPYFNVGKQ